MPPSVDEDVVPRRGGPECTRVGPGFDLTGSIFVPNGGFWNVERVTNSLDAVQLDLGTSLVLVVGIIFEQIREGCALFFLSR
jgi:hypothetical protein